MRWRCTTKTGLEIALSKYIFFSGEHSRNIILYGVLKFKLHFLTTWPIIQYNGEKLEILNKSFFLE
jgi:hypothetical protein